MKILLWTFVIFMGSQGTIGRHAFKEPSRQKVTAKHELPTAHLLEIDTLTCPTGCVCQYAPFNCLPIARWINQLELRGKTANELSVKTSSADAKDSNIEQVDSFEPTEDDFVLSNPIYKQATCILQAETDISKLINSLPMDLQALVLLYTDTVHVKLVNTSMLKPLNQLYTLEIRGAAGEAMLRLVFDEPLSFLKHANFERIRLMGSENSKHTKAPLDPNDEFDYKPRIEYYENNEYSTVVEQATVSGVVNNLEFELAREDAEIEILPYEVYKMEVKKSRMPSFYGWSHLQLLRIHECQLNELHWEIFDGLSALQHLSLEHNDIELLPPHSLFGARHIKTLSLAHNRLHRLHYRSLGGLLDLQMLDISNNRLEKLSELSFPPFPKLVRADFRNNPLHYIFPATFWVMNETLEMQFGSTAAALELWANHPFDSLHKLRTLRITNVSIANLDQGVFKGLKSLQLLQLRGNIHTIDFDAFAGLNELRELDLSYCNIQQLSMDTLIGCQHLERLNLAHNNISYIPPGFFDDQKFLEDIYLEHNQLRTLPHTFFLQPKLTLAHLHNNPWQCSCEMNNWLRKVTNTVRGELEQRCITDFMTGKQIACRRMENLKQDRSLVPRCANYNGRSVYYVLRKDLHCGEGRVLRQLHVKSIRRGMPHWQKVELQRQYQLIGKSIYKEIDAKELSIRRKTSTRNRNSLNLVLQKQQQSKHPKQSSNDEKHLSNEI